MRKKTLHVRVLNTEQNDIWFQHGKAIEWENADLEHDVSSCLRCQTIKKAHRVTSGILNRWPNAVVRIERWNRSHYKFEVWRNRKSLIQN